MNATDPSIGWPMLGYVFIILTSSLDTALKYGGGWMVVGYLAVFGILLAVWLRTAPAFLLKISERNAIIFSATILFAIAIAAIAIYPYANVSTSGVGSDADDALIAASRELISGNFPYYKSTYLGNPISPMPGSAILAIPFVLTGLFPLINVFWLAGFFIIARQILGKSSLALGLLLTVLIFCPTVWQNILTGSDYVANSIFIIIFMWLVVRFGSDPETPEWQRAGTAILLGIGLSSRSNFLLLMPLLFSILWQHSGWWTALKLVGITGVSFVLITVPFWFYDPGRFGPFIAQAGKMTALETVLPYAGVVIPLGGFAVSGGLSLQAMDRGYREFFRNCAIVQVVVLLLTSTIYSIKLGRLDLYLGQSGYGMFALFFAAVAAWIAILPKEDLDSGTKIDRLS